MKEPIPITKPPTVTSQHGIRHVKSIMQLRSNPQKLGRMELDSHADTIVGGNNCILLETTGRTVSVSPFSEEYDAIKDIPIATIATAYECPSSGQVYILIFNEALYFGHRMTHSLLCPNQLRSHGIQVDDTPVQYNESSTHSLYIPDHDLRIPLSLDGIISGFETRQPTNVELDDVSTHVELSSPSEWNPHSKEFLYAESDANNLKSSTQDHRETDEIISSSRQINALCSRFKDTCIAYSPLELQIDPSLNENMLYNRLIAAARVIPLATQSPHANTPDDETDAAPTEDSSSSNIGIHAIRRGDPECAITPDNIAKKWRIGLDSAKRTMRVTTQLGIRSLASPAQRRFNTAMPHLRYPKIHGTFYADTMKGTLMSIRGFKYAHIIGNGKGFSKLYPMITKGETVQSLDAFVKTYGIMDRLITDGDPAMKESQA